MSVLAFNQGMKIYDLNVAIQRHSIRLGGSLRPNETGLYGCSIVMCFVCSYDVLTALHYSFQNGHKLFLKLRGLLQYVYDLL